MKIKNEIKKGIISLFLFVFGFILIIGGTIIDMIDLVLVGFSIMWGWFCIIN